ncbi:hypothetical protein [Mesorhizobium sp. M0254]|uniref:hypothetical protein n=1 Tax=Mesorhizobium sp. M0254 TaxID=2956927 RepID=UPI003335EECF
MPEHYPIHFTGRRWPAVLATSVSHMLVPVAGDPQGYETVSVSRVEVRGDGRRWRTTKALGLWRTFSEIETSDPAQVMGFVMRYGDPNQKPDDLPVEQPSPPVRTFYSYKWDELAGVLRLIGDCWQKEPGWGPRDDGAEEAGADGVCHVRDGEPSEQVHRFIHSDLAGWKPIIGRFDSRTGFRLDASSLADFMVASAVQHLFRRMPLKRCAFCSHWFAFERTNMKTCSDACRNALSRDTRSDD